MSGSASDKTEPPTPKRIRDARKKGQVAKSKEVVSAAIIVSLLFYFLGTTDYYLELFRDLFAFPYWLGEVPFSQLLDETVNKAFELGVAMIAAPVGIALVMAIASSFAQVGTLFAAESVKPDIKKVNPATAVKNIFSKKNLVELLKSLAKISILGVAVAYVIWQGMPSLMLVPSCGLDCLMPTFGNLFRELVNYVALAFIIVAVADFAFQKADYIKGLKMSKDEIKREFKESEGSPEIKSRRRSLFQEIINSQEVSNVRRSSVVVANPIHLAVGLQYDSGKTPLPVVTLKEQGLNAQRVVAIAEQEDIPVMINVPLARSLMDDADVDQYIPDDLIRPVAEVLRLLGEL
ncbi:MAG: type III secretion system export apparatus subunit SctU [Gammaproteobacteria bacterium]|nr:type III secretion system export apparatus subunit SctU [Gammaproteobacteria bacterium]MDE0273941.1 type III secretion system export apparatus subunit SctU [Gammaproteobacteria bacterium]